MKRPLAIVSLAILTVLLAAIPASGAKPIREFLPNLDGVIEGACEFPVAVTVLENNEFTTTFFKDGNVTRVLVTGRLVVELTNLDNTDESLVANISGPGVFTFTKDTTLLKTEGNWLLVFFPGDLGEGQPGQIWLTSGLFVLEFSEEGQTLLESHGTFRDVCVLLG
jgi:hypothetical protein